MAPPAAITTHTDFNFSDGDIVLAVTGNAPSATRDRVMCLKVHKCMLRMHSGFFDKMLELPLQPSSDGDEQVPPLIDGLLVLQLHDEPEDVLKLLKVIYFSPSIPYKPLMRDTFDFIAPVVKLADKYDMNAICESLIPRVQADWPVTLEKWDLITGHIAAMKDAVVKRQQTDGDYDIILDQSLVEPAGVIRFGRAHVESILPAAFYHLSRLSPAFKPEPDVYNFDTWDHICDGGRTARRTLLHAEDYECLYAGQGAIKMWLRDEATYGAIRPWREACGRERMEGTQPCGRDRWWSEKLRPKLLSIYFEDEVDVLAHIQETINDVPTGLCKPCEEAVETHLRLLREAFWKKLPEFFQLPSLDVPKSEYDCPF